MTSTDELERMMREATPGPIRLMDGDPLSVDFHAAVYAPKMTGTTPVTKLAANAALIVAAVNALPELVARVRRLEEALKPFADEADKWANCIDKDAQEILIAHPIDVTVDSDGEIDGLNDAAFTLGDLRRARAALKETGQ